MDWLIQRTSDGWIVHVSQCIPILDGLRPRHFSTQKHALDYAWGVIRANAPGRLFLFANNELELIYSVNELDCCYNVPFVQTDSRLMEAVKDDSIDWRPEVSAYGP